ncbi:MBOAT family O-acyltransferase [Candidatus Arthromitus sp. SFB-rat-Yit]|uniref:MBOAT family O-acyltransferase n=1 Tax=Candidatus Arthromitus sp. SFB-rat-Yit TaxID=1041504 RepID=UPI000227A62E|nr:MBOAT family O-acyltransferase [Candidatus Arthromitus sp. SFB-rat-Yit]BAK80588.1 alginate O-acetylation protein [Candidatus Arthromitus sp. SFB-rat-Yit]
MVFSSLIFIFFFLPITLFVYYISPKSIRLAVLFIASLLFYAFGEPLYIFLMIFSTILDYTIGLLIDKYRRFNHLKITFLIISILINLCMLGFFKYSNLIITSLNSMFNININFSPPSLPIGISFYTFQTLSYTIDVFLNKINVQKNFISFGAYVSLFPQLIAGPIVTYKSVEEDINNKNRETISLFNYGVTRFMEGICKKVIIANNMGYLFDTLMKLSPSNMSTLTSWMCIFSYFFQIYFDFSGYSDMAIGLGAMFGFKFNENFNYPYTSKSVTEFWRRWHISLGSWFRNYLYIPLGGNRRNKYFNLFIVWMFTGLWHGANFNFILWGIYFFIFIVIEKLFLLKFLENSKILSRMYLILVVLFGWCIFVFEDFNYLKEFVLKMLSLNNFIDRTFMYYFSNFIIYFGISILFSTPIMKNIKLKIPHIFSRVFIIIGFLVSISFIVNSSFNPFLYFRF